MNRLDLQCRFNTTTSGDGTFTGYAVVFGDTNRHRERVERGAFAKTLARHRAENTRPLMLWSHDQSRPIGVWTGIEEDATGLRVQGSIVRETRDGQEAYALLKAGALNGLSIGFNAIADRRDTGGIRVLTEIDLAEISLVSIPSAGRARISEVRANPNAINLTAFTNACREAARTFQKGT